MWDGEGAGQGGARMARKMGGGKTRIKQKSVKTKEQIHEHPESIHVGFPRATHTHTPGGRETMFSQLFHRVSNP